mgnify:FL=1
MQVLKSGTKHKVIELTTEMNTYTLQRKRLDEAGFIKLIKQWNPNGSQ